MNGLLERAPSMEESPYPNLPEDFSYASGTVACGALVEVESSGDITASKSTATDDDEIRDPYYMDGKLVPVGAVSFDAPED